ncbi:Suppressor of mec-8 and unc-52 protein-like 2 [Vitis vinifera]|uniref:Suppressor of mec-8 and unc-52 protein-like 2 n=1 Tax=Vitis vinifera TaxID=29760 RepID=A0A438HM12_VITVI|nr:Suppressor of mec-8 and unc-52 protein-like 2 [Vitis vinifera]
MDARSQPIWIPGSIVPAKDVRTGSFVALFNGKEIFWLVMMPLGGGRVIITHRAADRDGGRRRSCQRSWEVTYRHFIPVISLCKWLNGVRIGEARHVYSWENPDESDPDRNACHVSSGNVCHVASGEGVPTGMARVTFVVAHINEIVSPLMQTVLSLMEQRVQNEYMLVGPPRIGKTQFCLKLSSLASPPASYGGNGKGDDADGKSKVSNEDQPLLFRIATAKSMYQWIVKPQTIFKSNEMFLLGRMSYLCLGSSGKVLKKKKKERDVKEKISTVGNEFDEEKKPSKLDGGMSKNQTEKESLPPPLPSRKNYVDSREKHGPSVARPEQDGIFVGDGVEYDIPNKDMIPPSEPQGWQQTNGYDAMQAQELVGIGIPQDPHFMTQEEKDWVLGFVFKRDDKRLQQLREKDAREKDPNFILESHSEYYPGYQEYNSEVGDGDDEDDLSKMDMGKRAKGRLHRWDFETEEKWATYNKQKEAMPKVAFQFGVKMQVEEAATLSSKGRDPDF